MRKLLQLTCLAGVLFSFTQCATYDMEPTPVQDPTPVPEAAPDSEPTPNPDEETWQLTFDNCRKVLYGYGQDYYYYIDPSEGSVPEEYINLTRNVTFRWSGNRFSIKGMFPAYPEAWVNGTVKDGKVYFEKTQLLEGTDGEQMYFHSGEVFYRSQNANRAVTAMLTFRPPTSEEYRDYNFVISEDMNEIKSISQYTNIAGDAFWISKDKERKSVFHTTWRNGKVEGTPFPDTNSCMMNMVFRKVSSSGVGEVRPDPK